MPIEDATESSEIVKPITNQVDYQPNLQATPSQPITQPVSRPIKKVESPAGTEKKPTSNPPVVKEPKKEPVAKPKKELENSMNEFDL